MHTNHKLSEDDVTPLIIHWCPKMQTKENIKCCSNVVHIRCSLKTATPTQTTTNWVNTRVMYHPTCSESRITYVLRLSGPFCNCVIHAMICFIRVRFVSRHLAQQSYKLLFVFRSVRYSTTWVGPWAGLDSSQGGQNATKWGCPPPLTAAS